MQEQEEILSKYIKNILVQTKNFKRTNFISNDDQNTVSLEEGAFLTLLVEARRRNWSYNRLMSYLKNETGLPIDIGPAQCGIL